jgi:UDP-glucose 4-epimerase
LRAIHLQGALEVVTVRHPDLWSGCRRKLSAAVRCRASWYPFALGATKNFRDLLVRGNLADFLLVCASHSAASGHTYLVSDGTLCQHTRCFVALRGLWGCPSRLFPVPPYLLQMVGNLTGSTAEFERLLSSLRVDGSKVCRDLGWYPPFTLRQGLQATADWYRQVHKK